MMTLSAACYGGALSLPIMSATHLVAGYESGAPGSGHFARIEIYKKWYRSLPLDDADRLVSQRAPVLDRL